MNRKGVCFLVFIVCINLILFAGVSCKKAKPIYRKPESFIVDAQTGEYYISNLKGMPATRDDNGFITKLDKNRKVLKEKFIDGNDKGITLDSPRGLVIIGNTLYVADLKFVRAFDKVTGKNLDNLELAELGAMYLNDTTCDDDGNLYVSDFQRNIIFKIETKNDNKKSVFRKGGELGNPNGLVINPKNKKLVVVCWNGNILEIEEEEEIEYLFKGKFKHLDGADFDSQGNLYVSGYTDGEISRIAPDRSVKTILTGLNSPADISVDKKNNLLLVPLMNANEIKVYDLKSEKWVK